MAIEPRNGLGIAYRALQQDLVELWKLYQGEGILTEQEAKNIVQATGKISHLSASICTIADAFIVIAGARPKLDTPAEIGSLEEKIIHETEEEQI